MRRSRKPKVLCLGMSYADIEGQLSALQKEGKDQIFKDCRDGSVDSVIRCVRRGLVSAMDGRDLARCISTEKTCGVDVYTVSQEKGAVYRDDRHLDANFNRYDFVRSLRKKFGEDCCFDEIILDYFWIPQGWDASRWSKSFFEETLMGFASENVLRERTGAIYLPFCLHCFKFVHIYFDKLKRYFNISFIRKKELKKVSLWRGTQEINSFDMQHFLEKKLSQEDIYCTFGPKNIAEAMEDSRVSKSELIELATSLEDFHSIRFLCLKLLPGPRPALSKQACGSFIGCTDPRTVKRGFNSMTESSPCITGAERNSVGQYSVLPARFRSTIKAKPQSQRNRVKRSLFTAGEQRTPTVSSDSLNSDSSVRKTIQSIANVTPNSTPRKRTRHAKPTIESTLIDASQAKGSTSITPLVMNNKFAHFSGSLQHQTVATHRYATRRQVSLRKPSPSTTISVEFVEVVTPDLSDSSISSMNRRSRSGSPKPSHLSPRGLFSPISSTTALKIPEPHYIDFMVV